MTSIRHSDRKREKDFEKERRREIEDLYGRDGGLWKSQERKTWSKR